MIMLKKMLSLLLLGCLISQSFFCVAELMDTLDFVSNKFHPQIQGKLLLKVSLGIFLSKVDKNISGSIKLSWSDEQYAPAAKAFTRYAN